MLSDSDLLRRYAKTRSDEAFAELVHRYLGLVYSAALRQLAGDIHRAKDVSQMVFTDLARKAGRLERHPALSAWLYKSTRYAAAGIVRTEIRRKHREEEANAMHNIHEMSEPAADWVRIGPVIDEVIFTLNEREREAICLRYFSGRTFAEIGASCKITADAARFRVERGLDKMREQLFRRGVSSTAAALALVLETQVCSATPAGMVAVIVGAASAAVGSTTAGLVLQLMATYKQVGIAAALAAAAIVAASLEVSRRNVLQNQIVALSDQVAPLPTIRAENKRLQQQRASLAAARARPARVESPVGTGQAANAAGSSLAGSTAGPTRRKAVVLNQQPMLLDMAAPTYPSDLLGSGISGTVRIEFVGDDEGNVSTPMAKLPGYTPSAGETVLMTPFGTKSPSPLPTDISDGARNEIEMAAIKSVSQAVFRAGIMGGRPVNSRMLIDVQVSPPAKFIPPTQ